MHYTHYSVVTPTALNERQKTHIDEIFQMASSILELKRVIDGYSGTTIVSPLSRLVVSELHNWRLGFKNFSRKKFDFISEIKTYVPSEKLTKAFDGLFLQVREHRNVLQHYGMSVFGDQKAANVKPSELKRIGAYITVAPGASMAGFMSNYVGGLFCSSGKDGKIYEVNLSGNFELCIKKMVYEFCLEISSNKVVFEITPHFDLSREEKEQMMEANRQSLLKNP